MSSPPPLTKNLELAVPGTYIVGEAMVTIGSFRSQLHVITSKQRPRKLTILGSDGAEYMFLLKVSLDGRGMGRGDDMHNTEWGHLTPPLFGFLAELPMSQAHPQNRVTRTFARTSASCSCLAW